MALQEVRASADELQLALPGWQLVNDEALAKGRAGVAIAGRLAPTAARTVLGEEGLDSAGRWLEADFDVDGERLTVVSAYVHTGEADSPRQDAKWAFLDAMERRMPLLGGDVSAVAHDGRPERRAPRARHPQLEGQRQEGRVPASRARLLRPLPRAGRRRGDRRRRVDGAPASAGPTSGACTTATSTGRTPGGRCADAPSTTTRDGASTITSRLPSSLPVSPTTASCGHRPGTRAGATTHRCWPTTRSVADRFAAASDAVRGWGLSARL